MMMELELLAVPPHDRNGTETNTNADVFTTSKSLDSALKKNTAFIKRLRTGISASALSTFLADIRTLSLHKYLSEIISACYEGLCKLKSPGEIAAGVEIISALHQRFGPGEFTRQIGWLLGRGLSTPDKAQLKALTQEMPRAGRKRPVVASSGSCCRVVTELWLVGVLETLDDVEQAGGSGRKGQRWRRWDRWQAARTAPLKAKVAGRWNEGSGQAG